MYPSHKLQDRAQALEKLKGMDQETQLDWDKKLATSLNELIEKFSSSWKIQYSFEPLIGLYLPVDGEPNLLPLINLKPSQQSFPVRLDEKNMDYVRYAGNLNEIPKGNFFFKSDKSSKCEPDLILVPGLMFDRQGFRLGRGRGYFDVYLETHHCLSVGLCYSWQLTKKLMTETHDRKVNIIVTENEIINLSKDVFLLD